MIDPDPSAGWVDYGLVFRRPTSLKGGRTSFGSRSSLKPLRFAPLCHPQPARPPWRCAACIVTRLDFISSWSASIGRKRSCRRPPRFRSSKAGVQGPSPWCEPASSAATSSRWWTLRRPFDRVPGQLGRSTHGGLLVAKRDCAMM